MSQGIRNLVADLRSGRESWRVFAFFWSCALAISSAATIVRIHIH